MDPTSIDPKKVKLITVGAGVILVLLMLIYFVVSRPRNADSTPTPTPYPTLAPRPSDAAAPIKSRDEDFPTEAPPAKQNPGPETFNITPQPFTGVNPNDPIYSHKDADAQYVALYDSLPVDEPDFSIEYSFADAKFKVTYKNDQGNASFKLWKRDKYPLIDLANFVLP